MPQCYSAVAENLKCFKGITLVADIGNGTMNHIMPAVENNTGAEHQDSISEFELDEPEENDLLDLSIGF